MWGSAGVLVVQFAAVVGKGVYLYLCVHVCVYVLAALSGPDHHVRARGQKTDAKSESHE
jgi:hypothetical protein